MDKKEDPVSDEILLENNYNFKILQEIITQWLGNSASPDQTVSNKQCPVLDPKFKICRAENYIELHIHT